jgi:hypothetical protein
LNPRFTVALLAGRSDAVKKVSENIEVNQDLFIEIDRQLGYFYREF